MKRLMAILFACVVLGSCNKIDDEHPGSDSDSEVQINNVVLNNVGLGANVTGYFIREYIIQTDSTPVTEMYKDSFTVTGNGYNRNFYFDTPDKAIKCNIQVKISIVGSTASSASVGSFIYYKDQASIFVKNDINMSGEGNNFYSGVYTVTF